LIAVFFFIILLFLNFIELLISDEKIAECIEGNAVFRGLVLLRLDSVEFVEESSEVLFELVFIKGFCKGVRGKLTFLENKREGVLDKEAHRVKLLIVLTF
jgi:hypothetical protein